jgi:hypothetical protein
MRLGKGAGADIEYRLKESIPAKITRPNRFFSPLFTRSNEFDCGLRLRFIEL